MENTQPQSFVFRCHQLLTNWCCVFRPASTCLSKYTTNCFAWNYVDNTIISDSTLDSNNLKCNKFPHLGNLGKPKNGFHPNFLIKKLQNPFRTPCQDVVWKLQTLVPLFYQIISKLMVKPMEVLWTIFTIVQHSKINLP